MEIKGTVAEIRFRNEENGYTIATVETEIQPFVVVGVFPPVGEGSYVCCEGNFVTHSRFGRQFKADFVRPERPDSFYGLVRFLGSGLIKGIGEKRAAAIVEKFGLKTLDIIENEPGKLAKISGISPKMAKQIAESYDEIKSAGDVMTYLMEYGISGNLALRIFNVYGKDAIGIISSNPYRLTEDVRGIGFLTADRIAGSIGISPDSDFRLRAGLVYVLTESAEKNGNTLLPLEELLAATKTLLGEKNCAKLEENLEAMYLSRKLRQVVYDGENAVMTEKLFKAESFSAAALCRLCERANRAMPDCSGEIAEFERNEGVKFHEDQRKAIQSALKNGVSVITGGPGTGKTTIIRCILHLLSYHGVSVRLLAPTGRAAKRLSESTGAEASTIHRALAAEEESIHGSIEEDAVIVDEFSMVDVSLLASLLKAMRPDAKLVIVGDVDQLPSVGAGNALADIINCGEIPVAKLTRIYRQGDGSGIIVNAHKINEGKMPDLKNTGNEFFFMHAADAQNAAILVRELVTHRLPAFLGCEPTAVQVLCPVKNGDAGCNNLNRILRDALLPDRKEEITVGDYSFSSGDKVMHTVNNYSLTWTRGGESGDGVFNGDMGTVEEVKADSGEMIVRFEDGRTCVYTGETKSQLMPAYAVTVHKSQGSEYEGVVIPLIGGNYMIMTRNLLYTAVTRARRLAVIVGTEETVARTVNNNYIRKRYSLLKALISEARRKMDILYGDEDDTEDNEI